MSEREIDQFLRWCAQYRNFPYGQMLYWVDAFKRHDGTDMYERNIAK
jgi:hypothetical protein